MPSGKPFGTSRGKRTRRSMRWRRRLTKTEAWMWALPRPFGFLFWNFTGAVEPIPECGTGPNVAPGVLLSDHVVLWPIRKAGQVVGAVFGDHQNVVLAVPTRAGRAFGTPEHQLERAHLGPPEPPEDIGGQ